MKKYSDLNLTIIKYDDKIVLHYAHQRVIDNTGQIIYYLD